MFGVEQIEITSAALVKILVAIEGRPWADGLGKNRDKPLTQNRLALMLKALKPPIGPQKVGPEDDRLSGYVRAHFEDAFERYLPPEGVSQPDIRTEADETGTSDISRPDSLDDDCPVVKSQKSNNDGLLSGCPVAKGRTGQSEHAEGGNGLAPGLSQRRIVDLAHWYTERAYATAQETGGDTRTAELDSGLRQVLAEQVLPESIEVEFERVMAEVFRV